MKELDYGAGYQYSHDFPGHFVQQAFLPDALRGKILYEPAGNPAEERVRQKLREDWKNWYPY
jgi:putative ATPase